MNVSMIATLASGDAGAGSTGAADKEGTGEEFGIAVKDAAQHHGRKTKTTEAGSRAHGDAAADRDAPVDGDTAPADDAADRTGDLTPTGDLLGRILGASFLSAATPPAMPTEAGTGKSTENGKDEAADELEERIVISTVADLAGDKPEEQAKRVALRVTGMETHFEPLDGAAKLVDADSVAAAAGEGAVEPTETRPAKQPFAEILQRLGTRQPVSDGRGAQAGLDSDAQGDGGENAATSKGETAQRRAENSSTKSGLKSAASTTAPLAAVRSSATQENQTTGQAINSQLAERIIGAFAEQPSAKVQESAASSQTGSSQLLRMTAGGGALKTLSIQLEPQDLGRVDVSMRLVDGRLKVELAASEPSTAAALAGDKHGLRKILEHAGFALDDAAITIVARDLNAASSASSSSSGDAGGGRQSASQDQGFGSNDNRRNDDRQPSGERRQPSAEPRGDEAAAAGKRQGGSVYL